MLFEVKSRTTIAKGTYADQCRGQDQAMNKHKKCILLEYEWHIYVFTDIGGITSLKQYHNFNVCPVEIASYDLSE